MAKLPTVEQMKFRRYPPLKSGPPILWPTKRYFRRNEGTTDYATIPEVTLAGDYSVSVLVFKPEGLDVRVYGNPTNTDGRLLILGNGTINFKPSSSSSAGLTTPLGVVESNKLTLITVTRVGATGYIFVSGVEVMRGPIPISPLNVNTLYNQNGTLGAGILANLKIYDAGTLIRNWPISSNATTEADLVSGSVMTIINGNADDWGLFDKQASGDWLGQELVVNGGFDSTAGWNKDSNWSISNSQAISDGSVSGILYRLLDRPDIYRVSGDFAQTSTGNLLIYNGRTYPVGVSGTGGFSVDIANDKPEYQFFTVKSESGNAPILDNISVKEVLKNA